MQIRSITKNDYPKIDQLIRKKFEHSEHGYGNEVELVNSIRSSTSYIQ